jgi:hypothetical protein
MGLSWRGFPVCAAAAAAAAVALARIFAFTAPADVGGAGARLAALTAVDLALDGTGGVAFEFRLV